MADKSSDANAVRDMQADDRANGASQPGLTLPDLADIPGAVGALSLQIASNEKLLEAFPAKFEFGLRDIKPLMGHMRATLD